MKKIALIGCGYWGRNYIKTLKKIKGLELIWIHNHKTMVQKRDLPPTSKFTLKYSDIIRDKTVDAVIIATPPSTHFKLAKTALEHGKDVLLEKPFTDNSQEAKKLCRISKKQKKIIMVGHIFLYNSAINKLKAEIEKGALGDIYYIYSNRSGYGPMNADTDIIWSLASHDISIINYLINQYPIRSTSKGYKILNKKEDTADIILDFKSKTKAFLHLSRVEPLKKREIIIVGSKKTAVFNDLKKDKLLIFENSNRNKSKKINLSDRSPLENQCLHFLDCIENRKKPLTDCEEGYKNVKAIELIKKY